MTNRAELVRRLIVHEAAAKEIKNALKAEGEHEHRENGTTTAYRMAYARVTGSETADHLDVVDVDAFLAYLAGRYPSEVTTRTVQVVRNSDWLAQVKDALARMSRLEYDDIPEDEERPPRGPVIDGDGTVIPGVAFVPGGDYITTSVTPTTTARRRALTAARKGILEGDWSALERAITDPGYLARQGPDEEPMERHGGREVQNLEDLASLTEGD